MTRRKTNLIPVTWNQEDAYTSTTGKRAQRQQIETLVRWKAPHGTVKIVIYNGWHDSRSDFINHATANYYLRDGGMVRYHVYQ
ncbi:hypothetical protein D6C79_09332 [Aureobasidium pullulans]|nr:hypothetical protein D6C79_09332 [Aureobasidium pullulans]